MIDQEWVQVNLARVHAKLEFLRLANWRVAWLAQSGAALNPADASTIKVYGTEFYMEAARLLMEVMRDQATLQGDSPGAVLHGRVERMLRSMHILTFGGGTNEMQRDLIAIFGLNMPGSPAIARATGSTMDFALSETQEELRGARARASSRTASGLQHLKERDRSDDWYDLPTWQEFAKANLLGIALPESAGGLGFGFLDLCMVLREVGRQRRRRCPSIPTLVSGALPIARFGTDAQQAILAKVASGDVLLTAALVEIGAEPEKPTTTATRDGDGWRINGVKSNVPGRDRGRARARTGDGRRRRSRCSSCRRGAPGITTDPPADDEPRAALRGRARRRAGRRRRAARLARPGCGDPRVDAEPHDGRACARSCPASPSRPCA